MVEVLSGPFRFSFDVRLSRRELGLVSFVDMGTSSLGHGQGMAASIGPYLPLIHSQSV
jgi:hypothetical protein